MTDDEKTSINLKWPDIQKMIRVRFNKDKLPDLNAVLMLIGINELGQIKEEYTKEEKENLMHIAICHLLSDEGYYHYIGRDEEGWPHWEPAQVLPKQSTTDDEYLLKRQIIQYFEA